MISSMPFGAVHMAYNRGAKHVTSYLIVEVQSKGSVEWRGKDREKIPC